jgi:hypothetical protein
VIAKQQQTIEALRRGEGPIGEVLLAVRGKTGPSSDYYREQMHTRTTPVATVVEQIYKMGQGIADVCWWGETNAQRFSRVFGL